VPFEAIQFDEFVLDRKRYELLRGGRRLRLEKLPMELLILLVEKQGELVNRQEIVERLWGPGVFVDTEHGINTAVRKIRTVLRDDPEQPRFVHTVTGKGYRFVAATTLLTEADGNGSDSLRHMVPTEPAPQNAINSKQPDKNSGHPVHKRSLLLKAGLVLGAGVACAAVLVAVNVGGLRSRLFAHAEKPEIHSLAVLPLENLSGDKSQEYFADGMTDELITMLAKNPGMRVISRTSIMQYKSVHRPLPEIARELAVDGILEGSVGRFGNRVHINVQLVHAPSDTHIWAESYDRDVSEVGSLQSELAKTIARQVGLTVAVPGRPERQISPEAHDAYLVGRYNWFAEDYKRSQEYLQKAIDLQPDYAAAWSGLADCYMASAVTAEARPEAMMPKAEQAAQKALALDDSLPETHASMAAVYYFHRWDWEMAIRESTRALELNPSFAEGHHLKGYILQTLNRTDEGLQEQKKSMELDPFSRPWKLAFALLQLRNFDAALSEARMRSEAQPGDPVVRQILISAYRHKGMEKEAAQEWETSLRLSGRKESADAVHQAFQRGGMQAIFEWKLRKLRKAATRQYVSSLEFAETYACLERKDDALHYLEGAYQQREPWLVHLQGDPNFDFLHSDPRYREIVRKMNLPQID
jgi:TolB-like protein/DNA-binding winged helix-turn-helix (wHTH) protein/Flp pilus assembly protein TadD